MLGRDLDNLYRLEEPLSAGSLAVTYRARRVEYGSAVAIKLFRAELTTDALQRFEAEAAAWEGLRHPNLGALADRGLHAGRPWIAYRWLQGESLAARIAGAPLQLSTATSIFRPLMAALASAHAARLTHRNLKPSNVFLEQAATQRRERVQLLDYMPAPKLMGSNALPTRSAYLAPEILAGEPADARSDVFAAGMLLVAMLTGGLPEPSASAEQAFTLPGVSGGLLAWIRRATASEPARRFANAGELLGELIDVLPRELRSGQSGSEELKRPTSAGSKSQPPRAAEATPARPRSMTPRPAPASAAPPPLASTPPASVPPASVDAAPISVPPPPRMPIEARALNDAELPAIEDHRSAPPAPRDEGGNSVRPIESPVIAPELESWSRLPMAAGTIGALVIAGLTLVQEIKHSEPGRARIREADHVSSAPAHAPAARPIELELPQPTPAPERASLDAPAPPEPTQPSAAAPKPTPGLPTLVAAPGHPALRDPWADPLPAELKRLHEQAKKGALADEPKVKALQEYNRDHRDDARGYLVIGQLYLNRHWRTDCVEEWATALQRDPGTRGAPEVLPGLIEVIMHGKAAPIAQALVLKAYGSEALPAIDEALDTVQNPDAAGRLFNLRLKITGTGESR